MNTTAIEKQETTNNVVQLRNAVSDTQVYNALQSIEQVKEVKREYCDEVLEFSVEHLFNCIEGFGFFSNSKRIDPKEIILLENIIQAMLYRYYGLEHPFQNLASEVITMADEDMNEGDGG